MATDCSSRTVSPGWRPCGGRADRQYSLTACALTTAGLSPATNLPAFPTNISTGDDGLTWVSDGWCAQSRFWMACHKVPALRKAIWPRPRPSTPSRTRSSDARLRRPREEGQGSSSAHERFFMVTGACVTDGRAAMGSLNTTTIAWFDLPENG